MATTAAPSSLGPSIDALAGDPRTTVPLPPSLRVAPRPRPINPRKAHDFEFPPGAFVLGWIGRHLPGLWATLARLEDALLWRRLRSVRLDRPVYITGMTRAGTTITLEMLARHPDAATFRYADLLCPHLPWLWDRLVVQRMGIDADQPQERPHRDRIMVTRASPEAGEEPLWIRGFPSVHDPSLPAVLDPAHPNRAFDRFYTATLRKLLLARGKARYVAKANYNVTRVRYLLGLLPDARFIVMVRDPFEQIASMMKHDRVLAEIDAREPRAATVRAGMGHFEHGPARRPIHAGDATAVRTIQRAWAGGDAVRGYALHWRSIYSHVLELLDDPAVAPHLLLVRYEDLIAAPGRTIDRMLGHAELDPSPFAATRAEYAARLSAPDYYRPEFTPAERDRIRAVTRSVAERLGY
ncbi:MAG: sulfotransferase [Myxococcales bacterium]|nr:sulfotransferase [Myxococcales bacterium]